MPENRRPEWVNPLDKIEQLLTCAVCLDRYRNPKLLPCQHTFCMDPCMEGLIDHGKRVVKCPECRAEHPIPYDGVKGYQTNYTLIGFLEVHLQAVDENSAEIAAYIQRYNMERCKVCDEKAEVEFCKHCEKRICLTCKGTHIEMLKRDLVRIVSQVKRISNRVTEAADTLSRGLDSLVINCETTKQEIHEYIGRFIRELKKREESLLAEADAFGSSEVNFMRTVRDNLQLEISNIHQACALVEASTKGETELSEEDLMKYKIMFTEGLESLKAFNPDADEFTVKRIRFAVGSDPHLLPHAITQFGELQIISAHLSSKTGTSFVPRFMNLVLESENYPIKRRYELPDSSSSRESTRPVNHTAMPTSYISRIAQQEPSERPAVTSKYLRPQDSHSSESSRISPVSQREDPPGSRSWESSSNSPWSRVHQLTEPQSLIGRDSPSPGTSPSRVGNLNFGSIHPADPPANVDRRIGSLSADMDQHHQELDDRIEIIRRERKALDDRVEHIRREHEAKAVGRQAQCAAGDSLSSSTSSSSSSHGTNAHLEAKSGRAKHQSEPSILDETYSGPTSRESSPIGSESHIVIPVVHYPALHRGSKSADELSQQLTVKTSSLTSCQQGSPRASPPVQNPIDWKKYLIPSPTGCKSEEKIREVAGGSKPSISKMAVTAAKEARQFKQQTTVPQSREAEEMDLNDRRQYFIRSKTNPDFVLEKRREGSQGKGSPNEGRSNSTQPEDAVDRTRRYRRSGSYSDMAQSPGPECSSGVMYDEPPERKNRYRRKAEKSHSAFCYGSEATEPDSGISISVSDQRSALAPMRVEAPRPMVTPKINYLGKGPVLAKFGVKGSMNGQFNWPRGLAVNGNIVAVCDSSNHRIQIFDDRGNHLKSFGSYGSARAEFDCLAGICINKYKQFIVTDRYNHRLQIFDSSGLFLREFGSHGQTNGRFSSPWGVAVDANGFIYVCDKDNHRIQVFQADGNFVGKFGGIGNREGQFQNPHFIVSDNRNNRLIVSDSSNHRIQVFDHNGHFLFAFGSEGFHEGQFKYPRGVAVDDQGFIIVADSGNNRCQIFYPDGQFLTDFGAWGTGDGQLKGVEGVALTNDGRIILSDRENHRLQIF